jgi:hypothetical protein
LIDLVLKWSPGLRPDTIERHREVARKHGAVWWGRLTWRPDATGLASEWVETLREQLETSASPSYVYLHSVLGGTWRARLLAITIDKDEVDDALVPSYYQADDHYSLWAKLTDFHESNPSEIIDRYVLARTGEPMKRRGLNNQTPLIVRRHKGKTR